MATLQKPDSGDREAVVRYADSLYEEGQWTELFEYLREALGAGEDPQLAWKLLRCGYRLGQQLLDAGSSKEAERIADIAMAAGKKALVNNDDNFGLHKVRAGVHQLLCLVCVCVCVF